MFKNIVRELDLTNDGKLFHSFEAAVKNAQDMVRVLTLEVVVSRSSGDDCKVLALHTWLRGLEGAWVNNAALRHKRQLKSNSQCAG